LAYLAGVHNYDVFKRAVIATFWYFLDSVYNVHAFNNLSKDDMLAIKPLSQSGANEL
jgi:hypothetical protein